MPSHKASLIERQIIRLEKYQGGDYSDVSKIATLGKLTAVAAGTFVACENLVIAAVEAGTAQYELAMSDLGQAGGVIVLTSLTALSMSYIEHITQPESVFAPKHMQSVPAQGL